MAGLVYGVYASHLEVVEAIRALKKKGFDGRDITVMADKETNLTMEKKEKVNISVLKEREEMMSFLKTIQGLLFFKGKEDAVEKLISLGLSAEETDVYIQQLEKGSIIVVLDPKKKDDPADSGQQGLLLQPRAAAPIKGIEWSTFKGKCKEN